MARPATSRSAISQLPGPGPMMGTPSRSPAVSSWSRSGLGDAGSGRDAGLMRRRPATGGELVVVLIALAGFDQADTRTTPISLCWGCHCGRFVTGSVWWVGCGLRLEECVDVVGELLGVLVQESVVGVRVDPQLGVGEAFSQKVAVVRVHHRVVVAVGDKRRLGDAGEPVELRLVGNSPGGDRGELRVASRQVSRLVTVDLTLEEASDRLHALGPAFLGAGEEQAEQVLRAGLVCSRERVHLVTPAVEARAALRRGAGKHEPADESRA